MDWTRRASGSQHNTISDNQTVQPSCGRPAITWIITRHNRLMVGVELNRFARCESLLEAVAA
jgi:hypothetical protein